MALDAEQRWNSLYRAVLSGKKEYRWKTEENIIIKLLKYLLIDASEYRCCRFVKQRTC